MKPSILDIDALLPQTQCGLCGYGGCLPYAAALVNEQAPIDRCPPGGIKTLRELARLLKQDSTPFESDMEKQEKVASIVKIRENECIGCTKCIHVCPVDAIIGAPKLMHTVLQDVCTGCDLCIPACPVDCIDVMLHERNQTELETAQQRNTWRTPYQKHRIRLEKQEQNKIRASAIPTDASVEEKKQYVTDAINRLKNK